MSPPSGVKFPAVFSARGRRFACKLATAAILVAAAGCTPAATRLAGTDPADPAARTARVGYRSTIEPYTSLRPATPVPWRERNDRVAPQPDTERGPR